MPYMTPEPMISEPLTYADKQTHKKALEAALKVSFEKLNKEQRLAVDTLDGPVMVVAGPGTGKTQILTLRIANILLKTDAAPSSILCLTFTRSGVSAMRDRLEASIGTTARHVKIATFHSFAIDLVEKYFHLLDFPRMPKLLADTDAVAIVDGLLQNGEWDYLRPRTDPTKYFHDLKSLISILKRERLSPAEFLKEVENEIAYLENDPDSLSSRGPTKGQMKKEVEKKIESLSRTREVVLFYEQYEAAKKENGLMDYDDVLEYTVRLVESYEDVRADLREEYQYVLVDEHQDSSGVQNAFLKAVWSGPDVERPDIFVVGDDRQLIYGFSGANVDYFTEFKTAFGAAKMITLTENYRSTGPILALADELLKSSVTNEALNSNREGADAIALSEYRYARDEIIGAGLHFKKLTASGVSASECALLLPKNRHVRSASAQLRAMGLPVVSEQSTSLLELPATQSLMRILKIVTDPMNAQLLVDALLDRTSGAAPLSVHKFLKTIKYPDRITLDEITGHGAEEGLFAGESAIAKFGERLKAWVETLSHERVSHAVSVIGNELLIEGAATHDDLLRSVEIVRSFITAACAWEEKNPTGSLAEFIEYFERLNTYGNQVNVAHLGAMGGVRVMTLHKSKGLEYDHVWIGHMNEEVFMSEKRAAFTLPEKVDQMIKARDVLTAKRELYVAITRARAFCTISYAEKRDDGSDLRLAEIIEDLSTHHFIKKTADESEAEILADSPLHYALKPLSANEKQAGENLSDQVREFVRDRFAETKISVSMLNNFFECPWKWYFRNFLKLPETKGVSLALGSAVHSTIEYILKERSLPNADAIKTEIVRALEHEGVYDPKERARLAKDAYAAVTTWVSGFYQNLAVDRKTERSISYRDKNFPNLSMYGKIDLTEHFPDGTIMVTDFKTGSSKTPGIIEKIDDEGRMSGLLRQLAMYSYLIRGAEGKDVTESRLLFLEEDPKNKNALYRTHITSEAVDLLIRDISDYQNLLISGEWVSRPCGNIGYGKGECEYCKMAEMLK